MAAERAFAKGLELFNKARAGGLRRPTGAAGALHVDSP
jgi:hypothetical protein